MGLEQAQASGDDLLPPPEEALAAQQRKEEVPVCRYFLQVLNWVAKRLKCPG